MTVDKIKEEIANRWNDIPAASLSMSIVEYLASLPEQELKFLTFRSLAKASSTPVGADLAAAVNILTGALSLLDAHAIFVDDKEQEYELDDEEFEKARLTGELVHPETGQIVKNAAEHIVPFFVPTPRFFKAIK